MDHLPIPKTAFTKERAIVPYVCLKDYDGGPFLTYPIREGVAHALPPDGNIPGGSPYRQHEQTYPTPKQEQEDFLQRWLFFGLIHEILGDRYKPEELISTFQTDDGEIRLVRTTDLVETLNKWIIDIRTNCVNPRHNYEHLAECLRVAFATIRGTGPDFDLRVKMSLASLGELFTLAVNEAYNAKENKCPSVFHYLIYYEDRNYENWKNTMLSSGWCPSQVKVIFDGSLCLQTVHFLTFLGSPTSDRLHQKCNNNQCLAYQNDLAKFQTRHLDGCNCEHLSIDTTRLAEILEGGSLPLIRIRRGHTLDELSVELVPSQATSPYIALSHVWAHGLGNEYENALPRCQLDFLHQTITRYYAKLYPQADQEVLLWCDTLCCPVEPEEAKKLAIKEMKKTYREATRVLVLDASLRVYDRKAMDSDEAGLRIINSAWTRRLWTLQEGALPAKRSRLVFLFRDEVINIYDLKQEIVQASKSDVGRKGMLTNIISQIENFESVSYKVDGNQYEDLGSVEAGLQNRSVSDPLDEPLLIANLLNLDIDYLLNGLCPLGSCANVGCNHCRIHRLWLLMPTAFRGIPRTILLRIGPTLSQAGFRWAPSTLLYNENQNTASQFRLQSKNEHLSTSSSRPTSSSVIESADRGTLTNRGLIARFTGYGLSMAQCPPGIPTNPWNVVHQEGGLYFRGVDGKWYMINRERPAEHDSFLSSKSLSAIIKDENNLWVTFLESDFENSKLVAEGKGGQQVATGLLVQLLSEEKGIKYVQRKVHVNVGLLQESVRNLFETAYRCGKEVSRKLPRIRAAANPEGLQIDVNDENCPQRKWILELLGQEIDRVGLQNANPEVAAAAAAFSDDGLLLFKTLIAMMVVGGYGSLSARTADSQEWCFD